MGTELKGSDFRTCEGLSAHAENSEQVSVLWVTLASP